MQVEGHSRPHAVAGVRQCCCTEIGVTFAHRLAFVGCLKRPVERDYRAVIAEACHRHATLAASLAVMLYGVTQAPHRRGGVDRRVRLKG